MNTKVYLFLGTETLHWTVPDFMPVINYCKAHKIDGLIVKIYEITQGEWNKEIGGARTVYNLITSAGLDCIPYGFFYGHDEETENLAILQYLAMFPIFCLNLEGDWDANLNRAVIPLTTALAISHGKTWISTWANPVDHEWIINIAALNKYVTAWLPEEYNDTLIDKRIAQFPPINGSLYSTYCINQEAIEHTSAGDIVTLWEYGLAQQYPTWVDAFIEHVKGTTMADPWYMSPIGVNFGTGDVGLGGAHDMTIKAPPNYPVTNLLDGTISSITDEDWGRQVGIKLTTPYNGVQYCAFLHLSAVDPKLEVGQHIAVNDLIGWVGGANTDSQYNGTSNPTGKNALNTVFMSSQIQVGFALMDGIEYGKAGWAVFPPIQQRLDPTQIILDARTAFTTPPVVDTSAQQFHDVWQSTMCRLNTGIYNALLAHMHVLNLCAPTSDEVKTVNWAGKAIIWQSFGNYHVEWDGNCHVYNEFNQLVVSL